MRFLNPAVTLKQQSRMIIFAVSCLAVFAGFYFNIYNASLPGEMESFGRISESLIMGRLAETRKNGLFSEVGLLGFTRQEGDTVSDYKKQYRIYLEDLEYEKYRVYKTISGFNGFVFGLFDAMTGFSNYFNIKLFRIFNSGLSAVSISLLLLFIFHYTGFLPWLLALLSVIFSIALTPFGSNLFYCLWALYLPFLIVLFLLVREDQIGRYSHKTALVLIFAGVVIKGLFNGMEFITSILIMSMVPLFFFMIKNKWPISLILKRFLLYCLAALSGVIFTLLILSVQIAVHEGSARAGVEHIYKSWHKRTQGEGSGYDFDPLIEKSLKMKTSVVLKIQFKKVAYRVGHVSRRPDGGKTGLTIKYGHLLGLSGLAGLLLLLCLKFRPFDKEKRIFLAILGMTAVSILAPFSWFIIFKGHTYIHYNLVNLVWYFPFMILAAATVGLALKTISTTFFSKVLPR